MEDFIGDSLANHCPGAGDEACLDLNEDIVSRSWPTGGGN